MTNIPFRVKLTTNTSEITYDLIQIVKREIDQMIQLSMATIEVDVRQLIYSAIWNCSAMESMRSDTRGSLKGHLGLEDPQSVLQPIVARWVDNITFTSQPMKLRGNAYVAGIRVGFIQDDYQDVLTMPEASYISDKSGAEITWLRWLLVRGLSVIINDYVVVFGSFTQSRSGQAIMVQGPVGWSVPFLYSGTQDDNFVTRALKPILPQIRDIIFKAVTRRLG